MNFMQRLMYGRYGGDQLSVFLIALYLLLYLLSSLLHSSIPLPAVHIGGGMVHLPHVFPADRPPAGGKRKVYDGGGPRHPLDSSSGAPSTGTRSTAISSVPTAASSFASPEGREDHHQLPQLRRVL